MVGTIDLCLKYGKELQNMSSALREAEDELKERVLAIDILWHRCLAQLDFIKDIHQTIDESHLALHERTLSILADKLNIATHTLRSLVETKVAKDEHGNNMVVFVPKPLKYARKKEKLDEAINSLEAWQRMSDPSWFLLVRMYDSLLNGTTTPSPAASQATESIPVGRTQPGLLLPPQAFLNMSMTCIPFSNFCIVESVKTERTITFILDEVEILDPESFQRMKKNVRDLASRLQHTEPMTFGLLSCKGFFAKNLESLTMVFRTPLGLCKPQSLRDRLLNGGKPKSLSERFLIAQELAKSISYVHTFGFVHKNIRPETILRFETHSQETSSIFLAGFAEFRYKDGKSRRYGDDAIERNLYRHPSRQGALPDQDFIMQHDIYSLGVCMLEIGLWQSFIVYDAQRKNPSLLSIVGISPGSSQGDNARFLLASSKEHLLRLTRNELCESVGTQHSEIVETCLTCLDQDNSFGDQREFEDEYGIRVGVRYIEKILHRLDSIRV